MDDVTGVVLAGGYSRRFGERDKALARVGDRPLLARVVARLGEAAESVIVNCRSDQREAFERALEPTETPVRFAEDPDPDRGPLYGFRVALDRADAETCALATCDTPFLDPELVAGLAARLDRTEAVAAAVRSEDGRVHPTPAVYRTGSAAAACETLLDSDEGRLSAVLDRLPHRAVPAAELPAEVARSLFDVDTPEDRERAQKMVTPKTSGEVAARR